MRVRAPHFLLFSESSRYRRRDGGDACESPHGKWRFVLEAIDGSTKFEAADEEPQTPGDRLDLLAVVRGLEALDQPSRVTVVTPSRYVTRGLRDCLEEWRESGWQWERFGKMAPIKNGDLWRRVDRALQYHEIDVRTWRFDVAEDESSVDEPSVEFEHDRGVEPLESTSDEPAEVPQPKRRVPSMSRRLRRMANTAWQQAAGLGRLLGRDELRSTAT